MLIVISQAIEAKFYERFAGVLYVLSMLSLLGLYIFGKTISGATSWYQIGSVSIQPSEFAKAVTGLALAKFLCDMQTNIKILNHQLKAFLIIIVPAILILPQPDPGSALVFVSFFFPLYREGLASDYLLFGFTATVLFVLTLLLGPASVVGFVAILLSLYIFSKRKTKA